jgi:hypothetical protein
MPGRKRSKEQIQRFIPAAACPFDDRQVEQGEA